MAKVFQQRAFRMNRVETLRNMGLDWAADLIERLERRSAELKAENARLKAELEKRK